MANEENARELKNRIELEPHRYRADREYWIAHDPSTFNAPWQVHILLPMMLSRRNGMYLVAAGTS